MSVEDFNIRTGGQADAAMLAALGAQTFADAYTGDVSADGLADFVAANFSAEVQAGELADEGSTFFIAEHGGAAVAYAYVKESQEAPGKVLDLARIYVRSDWFGHGVGRSLMEACLREAARRGAATIRLTVWKENARAIAFYRRWDFVEVGREAFFLGSERQTDLVLHRPVIPIQLAAGR